MERWQSWSIASDLKSDESHGSEGSNPSLSFFNKKDFKYLFLVQFFFLVLI